MEQASRTHLRNSCPLSSSFEVDSVHGDYRAFHASSMPRCAMRSTTGHGPMITAAQARDVMHALKAGQASALAVARSRSIFSYLLYDTHRKPPARKGSQFFHVGVR